MPLSCAALRLGRMKRKNLPYLAAAISLPLAYCFLYAPCGLDSTDAGYFYGYAWRILNGEVPYRDFYYIKPALPLYWHAMWMGITPEDWTLLGGRAGFLCEMMCSAWFCAWFLSRCFNFNLLGLPVSLLAACGFVFGVHTFPPMPWHTADGSFFASAALLCASFGQPALSALFTAASMLCKQSFLFIPAAVFLIFVAGPRSAGDRGAPAWRRGAWYLACLFSFLLLAVFFLWSQGALEPFLAMTTGQLAASEAVEAGILIYLRQNWWLPAIAVLPWLAWLCRQAAGSARHADFPLARGLPRWLMPCWVYLAALAAWYVSEVLRQRGWIGFGASWPTLFMLLGLLCAFWPRQFLLRYSCGAAAGWPLLYPSLALLGALAVSWSCAISGGYKIPAFYATPLVFSFLLVHAKLGGSARRLGIGTLLAGLLMFGVGYRYPYVFPIRPLAASELVHDAGQVYPRASGIMVDGQMLEKLRELKELRAKYGPDYKTLPGFTLSYLLNGDRPAFPSDWLIDWEINGEADKLYDLLSRRRTTVFMEKDQEETTQADGYARAGYTLPQLVRRNWKKVDETRHFSVYQSPDTETPPQN